MGEASILGVLEGRAGWERAWAHGVWGDDEVAAVAAVAAAVPSAGAGPLAGWSLHVPDGGWVQRTQDDLSKEEDHARQEGAKGVVDDGKGGDRDESNAEKDAGGDDGIEAEARR